MCFYTWDNSHLSLPKSRHNSQTKGYRQPFFFILVGNSRDRSLHFYRYPLMQASDFSLATFVAIPVSCITCTTSLTFLYASGISSLKVPLLEAITKTP